MVSITAIAAEVQPLGEAVVRLNFVGGRGDLKYFDDAY
jgi:hypothetical protein